MNLQLLYQWKDLIIEKFSVLGKWQATGLAIFSVGVILVGHCQASKVAENLAFMGKIPSIERRLRRWLSNSNIHVENCCQVWIRWIWDSLDAPRAVLLIDETKLGDRLGVMMVSLAYENRAIPLIWRCYRANSAMDYPRQGQVLLVWGLLAKVLEALPVTSRPVVQMDRGLGHSSAMLKALKHLGIHFQVCLKKNSTFTSRRGHTSLLRDLIQPGERKTCYGTVFRRKKRVQVTVHLVWELGQKEPWCLATNDPDIRGADYAIRIWQEESFKDLKSGGWQWQTSYVTNPERAERLILVLALAYAWMLTQGCFVLHGDKAIQREVFDGKQNKYSLFRSGLRFFKRMIHVNIKKIYVGLFFTPQYKPGL